MFWKRTHYTLKTFENCTLPWNPRAWADSMNFNYSSLCYSFHGQIANTRSKESILSNTFLQNWSSSQLLDMKMKLWECFAQAKELRWTWTHSLVCPLFETQGRMLCMWGKSQTHWYIHSEKGLKNPSGHSNLVYRLLRLFFKECLKSLHLKLLWLC